VQDARRPVSERLPRLHGHGIKALSVSHLEQAGGSEAVAAGRTGTIATLLPCASFHTSAGNPPARALVESRRLPIALGSDFHPKFSPTNSMQTVGSRLSAAGATPAEAITGATINGAHALGCAARTGSLEPGKSAESRFSNVSDYRDLAITSERIWFIHHEARRRDLPGRRSGPGATACAPLRCYTERHSTGVSHAFREFAVPSVVHCPLAASRALRKRRFTRVNPAIKQIVDQVVEERIGATMKRLGDFGTRYVASEQE